LRNKGIVLETTASDLADWLRQHENKEQFETLFASGSVQIRDRLHPVIMDFVPISHKAGDDAEYRRIEEDSGLRTGEIASTRWLKPIARRTSEQKVALVLVKFHSEKAANNAISTGLIMAGKRVKGRRLLAEPRRCLKCQRFGRHIAAQCKAEHDTCGTCGGNHLTKDCDTPSEQTQDHWCVSCDTHGHASWSRACPSFERERANMALRDPTATYRFFPT
ncbi:hypothetical protein FA95DRAFT_1473405, partial [Auriscalpium vulgare]